MLCRPLSPRVGHSTPSYGNTPNLVDTDVGISTFFFYSEMTQYDEDILLKHFTQKSFQVSPLPESQTPIIKELFRHFCQHLWRLLHNDGSEYKMVPIDSFHLRPN